MQSALPRSPGLLRAVQKTDHTLDPNLGFKALPSFFRKLIRAFDQRLPERNQWSAKKSHRVRINLVRALLPDPQSAQGRYVLALHTVWVHCRRGVAAYNASSVSIWSSASSSNARSNSGKIVLRGPDRSDHWVDATATTYSSVVWRQKDSLLISVGS